jgi:hypothetical protein
MEWTCNACKREAEFARLAREVRDPARAADSIHFEHGYRRTSNPFGRVDY